MISASNGPSPRRGWLETWCPRLALVLPWLWALAATSGTPAFAHDLSLVRSFGSAPLGLEGRVSAWLGQALSALPLGGATLRAEFVSAFALGAVALFVYLLSYALIGAGREHTRLSAPLSLMAALSAALGPSFVLEGSAPGGHVLAVALALGALVVALVLRLPDTRRAFLTGALLAATLLESRWAGVALAAALGVRWLLEFELPQRRSVLLFGFGAALVGIPLLLEAWLVAAARSHGALSAVALLGAKSALTMVKVEESLAIAAWFAEMGVLGLVLSLAGLVLALFDAPVRRALLPMLAFLAVDLAFDAGDVAPVHHDALLAVRLLAVTTLAAAGALALGRAIFYLARARIPFARPASVLLLVYGATLVLVTAEDSARAAETRASGAADAWTDEAFASLPPHSALLLHSEPVLLRLMAAQTLRGTRPDVLIVPLAELEQGGEATEHFARERGFVPLVRDMLLSGKPGEYALSALADVRPTFIDLDPSRDARLSSHLMPQAFFTRFAPQPLARSDRQQGSARGEDALERATAQLKAARDGDPATRRVIEATFTQRALILSALGDREDAAQVLSTLLRLEPSSKVGQELLARLGKGTKGRVDVSGLYAAR